VASSPHAQSLARHDDDSLLAGERLSFRLPAVDASAAEARRRVRQQLAHWRVSQETSDNAQLVVSELVTNALRHTASTSVGCELRVSGGLLRVSVASDGAGPSRTPLRATETDEGGRGLFLVCALAEGWGVRPRETGEGHVVWADLPIGRSQR
jgi:serine/threonine-protein kinase RsbW